jgi:hypothetical protein
MHSRTHAHACTRMHSRTHACTHARMHALTHACTRMHSRTHARARTHARTHTHADTRALTHARRTQVMFQVSGHKHTVLVDPMYSLHLYMDYQSTHNRPCRNHGRCRILPTGPTGASYPIQSNGRPEHSYCTVLGHGRMHRSPAVEPWRKCVEPSRSCGTRGPALGRNKYGLSPLDVDAVDMHRFPRAAEAPTAPRPHAELTPPTFRCMLDH